MTIGALAPKVRYEVTAPFSVTTPSGTRTFAPGTILDLVPDKAELHLRAGQLREFPPDQGTAPAEITGGLFPWRTESGRLIFLAEDPESAELTPRGAASFQLAELAMLRGATAGTVEMLIDCKEVFGNPTLQPETRTPAKQDRGPPARYR